MAQSKRRPAASAKADGSGKEPRGIELDLLSKPHAFQLQAITSPIAAVAAMRAAGAVFTIHRRNDVLNFSFTYAVAPDGDRDRCRAILADAKRRPGVFLVAFKSELIRLSEGGDL